MAAVRQGGDDKRKTEVQAVGSWATVNDVLVLICTDMYCAVPQVRQQETHDTGVVRLRQARNLEDENRRASSRTYTRIRSREKSMNN